MNRIKSLTLALAALGWLTPVPGQAAPDVDRGDRQGKTTEQLRNDANLRGDDIGTCSNGTASADLDANNIRARMYNTGGLFWKGGDAHYEVPRGSGIQSIFASGIWIGGKVGGEIRTAAATYAQGAGETYEYYPGPLGPNGTAPTQASCELWDRFFKVTQDDLDQLEDTGAITADIRDWPHALGAPVLNRTLNGIDDDGDGDIDEGVDGVDNDGDGQTDERDEQEFVDPAIRAYDIAAGDRPDIIGTQSIWWIMNDRGGLHGSTESAPIGLEITVQAFSFATSNAINNTTFYQYDIRYQGTQPLTDAYLGLWSDPDLGNATDDYVGADTELGLGFVYNADDDDEVSGPGYGLRPPALGYDYFQGPLVNNDGLDNDEDGEIDEDDERIALSVFIYYNNTALPNGNPDTQEDYYNYLQGIWLDGLPITEGFDGRNPNQPPTKIMFPGNPPDYWSEFDQDPASGAQPIEAGDRRFIMSSGPFTILPGEEQEIVFGIVWSQAAAGGALGSVAQLKRDDTLAQNAFNNDFEVPRPPDAPRVNAQPLDGAVALTWSNPSTSNNFLNTYDVFNPFAVPEEGDEDRTYTLEGYEVYRLDSPAQSIDQGERLAVFDRANGITSVTDVAVDPATGERITQVVASGLDNGLQNSFTVQGLVNNQTYYFAVRAYAYNAASSPEKIYSSPVLFGTNLVTVVPSKQGAVAGGTVLNSETGDLLTTSVVSGDVRAPFKARVVDPAAVTGDTYQIRFRNVGPADDQTLVYDVVNTTTGETEFDGESFFTRTGVTPISNQFNPANEFVVNDQVPIIDGFQLEILGLTAADVELYAPGCGNLLAAESEIDLDRGRPIQRVVFEDLTNGANTTVPAGTVVRFYSEVVGGTPLAEELTFPDFTAPAYNFVEQLRPGGEPACGGGGNQQGCDQSTGVWVYGENGLYSNEIPASLNGAANSTGEYHVTSLTAGPAGPGGLITVDDEGAPVFAPTDYEVRFTGSSYVYHLFTDTPNHPGYQVPFEVWDIGDQGDGSVPNDPSDDVKIIPVMFSDVASDDVDTCNGFIYENQAEAGAGLVTDRIYAYYPTTSYAAWEQAVETLLFPYQAGTVIEINTADFRAERGNATTAQDALDLIGVVPNPYRGRSQYETSANDRQVRFVNLPSSATIRIFTLSGTLVRVIEKPASTSTIAFWDLENQRGLPVASGMYLVHVEARDPAGSVIGERVLKLGVVQRRPNIDIL